MDTTTPMSWYRKAQEEEDDNDILGDAMKDFYAEQVTQKIVEIRKAIRQSIDDRLGPEGMTKTGGRWWDDYVEPYLISAINQDPSIVHSQDKIKMVADWVAGCALVGKTTKTWEWMNRCLTEMDSELVKAIILLIDNEHITDEASFEEAMSQYDGVMEDSNNKPGDSKRIAHELWLRMDAKQKHEANKQVNEAIKKYYIKANGSVCYDSSGITYPVPQYINWMQILLGTANKNWEYNLGMSNQPKVITFMARLSVALSIQSQLPSGLMVSEHWNNP